MKNSIFLILAITFSIRTLSQSISCTTSFIESDWSCLGPLQDAVSNMGRVISVWADPEDPNHILAGTRGSSLWETVNGGETWNNLLSYDFPAVGVMNIEVIQFPAYSATYCATRFNGSDMNLHNIGLIYFDDVSATWIRETTYPDNTDDSKDFKLEGTIDNIGSQPLKVRPETTYLWVANGQNIFKRNTTSSDSWTNEPVLHLDEDGDPSDNYNHIINEIDFVPGDNLFAFVSPSNGSYNDLLYTKNANSSDPTWEALESPSVVVLPGGRYEMTASTSIPNSKYAYTLFTFSIYDGPDDFEPTYEKYLYRYDISGTVPVLDEDDFTLEDLPPTPSNLLVFPDQSEAPPHECIIGYGGGSLYKAEIPNLGTVDFFLASQYSGINTHADIRAITYYDNPENDEHSIYIAHDGGVSRCDDRSSIVDGGANSNDGAWANLNGYGFTITEFLGFSNSELDKVIFSTGPDGNNYVFNFDWTESYVNYPSSSDGYDASISNENPAEAIFTKNSPGTRDPSFFSGHDIENFTDLLEPATPKSKQSACTDCAICPDNCREHNFSLKPFNFEIDIDGKYFWAGTSDMFRDPDPFDAASPWEVMSKTYVTLIDATDDDPANPFVITYDPITAYKKFVSDAVSQEISIYYATKETRNLSIAEDTIKLVKAKYIDNPGTDDFYSALDITPEVDEDATSGYYNQIDHSIITEIVIDETGPNKLWVSFGFNVIYDLIRYILPENHNAKKGRVYYSPDGGETWQNKSAGLPNYPVLSLCYWQGSDDIIFAGTDVGVYVWNKAEDEWQCFDTGDQMPYCSVNDLEINYCTMSLRASTFGFGIWETPLPILTAAQQKPIIINTDVTWTQDMDAKTDIIIEYPGSLTIQDCEIRMPENGKITVEQGARLDITDNAVVTNHCAYWNGIYVEGNKDKAHPSASLVHAGTYPSASDDHGVVYISDNSIISNCSNGIYTPNSGAKRGGIIVASNTTFKNNGVSVDMGEFDFLVGGVQNTDDDNISDFYKCTFTVDEENLFPNITTNYHVKLNDVDGVTFRGCLFEGSIDGDAENVSEGIYSTDATYTVTSVFDDCEIEVQSTFTGFFRGIEAANTYTGTLRPVEITYTNFSDNTRGVLLSSVRNSIITFNTFEVPDHESVNCYGLYLESSRGYTVEENTFTNFGSRIETGPINAGIYAANNSGVSTMVYRNTFEAVEAGIRCQ